jgi:aminoglycoside N3'-acetyltransferase
MRDKFEEDLTEAFLSVGADKADFIYIYSDFRYFGKFREAYNDTDAFCDAFVNFFRTRGQTVILPSFTYTKSGVFEIETTPTRLGVLNKWMLRQPEVIRSEHPIFSFSALGPRANLIRNIGKSAFGNQSVFERLKNKKAAFLHIGRPVYFGNTAIHYVEQTAGATYRVNKAFDTKIFQNSRYIGTNYSAFLRRRDVSNETFDTTFASAANQMQDTGLVRQVGNEDRLSNISFYWYDDAIDFMCSLFNKNPCIFIGTQFIGYKN